MEQNRQTHMLERVMQSAIRHTSSLSSRGKQEVPALSLVSIISSLRSLAHRGSRFAEYSTVPGDFFSWRRPSLTLTGLSIYTIICLHPQCIAMLPILAVLATTFIPQYARKFLIPEHEFLEKRYHVQLPTTEPQEDQVDSDLVNMLRSIQGSLSNLVGMLEYVDNFKETFGDFSDPHESTALFILLLAVLPVVYLVCFIIPLKLVFILFGWTFVWLTHPGLRAWCDEVLVEVEEIEEKIKEWSAFHAFYGVLKKQFAYNDLEMIREVEMFEIEKQGLTSRFWEPVGYMGILKTNLPGFGHQLYPHVKTQIEILPPENWFFNEAEGWELDKNASEWLGVRNLELDIAGGWVLSRHGHHRTRRYTRKCFYRPF